MTFQDLNLNKFLDNALEDMGISQPTPIQQESFNKILSGRDFVGIAQTGTGKTFAYMLPILRELKFSKQESPRILVLVPTRELVVQVVEETEKLAKYLNLRIGGVYGGVNMNTHAQLVMQGLDILVATPGRLYDLAISKALKLKSIQRVVIDEVDVMLDLGFRFQLLNIFDLMPEKRQNIMFSATMTEEVDELIHDFFFSPEKVTIAESGTPLDNIDQQGFKVPNFYTKVNLLKALLKDRETFKKVLVFSADKKTADILFDQLDEAFPKQCGVIHSNKTQNYRLRSVENFENGSYRILIASDIMARGMDFENTSHVISVDTPAYPENYIHRIGRTGRAESKGHAILLVSDKEEENLEQIETLMKRKIDFNELPEGVKISEQLLPHEREVIRERNNPVRRKDEESGSAYHEKSEKNKKTNLGGSYRRTIKLKYKKPKTRGDKNANRKRKK